MSVRTTVYLQVEPIRGRWDVEKVIGAKVVRMTQKTPAENQLGGTILVKITLEMPEAAFNPLQPEVVVIIPEGLTVPMPIEVEVEDPAQV